MGHGPPGPPCRAGLESRRLVSVAEMCAFLGCIILMGLHKLPAINDYWSDDLGLGVQAVADLFPRYCGPIFL